MLGSLTLSVLCRPLILNSLSPLSHCSHFFLFSNCFSLTGTFHQPMWQRDADAEYQECHIDGALRFDFRVIRDTSHQMPLMLPPAAQFEKQVGEVMMMM